MRNFKKKSAVAMGAIAISALILAPVSHAAPTVGDNPTKVSDAAVIALWSKYIKTNDELQVYANRATSGPIVMISGKKSSLVVSDAKKPVPYLRQTFKQKTSKSGMTSTYKATYLPSGIKRFGVKSATGVSKWTPTGSSTSATVKLSNGRTVKASSKRTTNNKLNGDNQSGSFTVTQGKKKVLTGSFKVLSTTDAKGNMVIKGTVKVTKKGKTTTTKVSYTHKWNKNFSKKILLKGKSAKGTKLHLKVADLTTVAFEAAVMGGKLNTSL